MKLDLNARVKKAVRDLRDFSITREHIDELRGEWTIVRTVRRNRKQKRRITSYTGTRPTRFGRIFYSMALATIIGTMAVGALYNMYLLLGGTFLSEMTLYQHCVHIVLCLILIVMTAWVFGIVGIGISLLMGKALHKWTHYETGRKESIYEVRSEADRIDREHPGPVYTRGGWLDRAIAWFGQTSHRHVFVLGERHISKWYVYTLPFLFVFAFWVAVNVSGIPFLAFHPDGVRIGDPVMFNDRFQPVFVHENRSSVNASYDQVVSFLLADRTSDVEYKSFWFTCTDYAAIVHNNAEAQGIRCAVVGLRFNTSGSGHAINAFDTTDRGLVYFDTTNGDYTVNGTIGELYVLHPLPGTILPKEYAPYRILTECKAYW